MSHKIVMLWNIPIKHISDCEGNLDNLLYVHAIEKIFNVERIP